MEKIYSSVFAKTTFKSGDWNTIGSIFEITCMDKSVMTSKTTVLTDDHKHFSCQFLSSDPKAPGYTYNCSIDDVTYDNCVVVNMETRFGEGVAADYMLKVRTMYQTCLNDLKCFFGSGMTRIMESCVVSGTTAEKLFKQYQSMDDKTRDVVFSSKMVKSCKFSKGDCDTLGSVIDVETMRGDKYALKLIEISGNDLSCKWELQAGTFKGCVPSTSMICGIKMTNLCCTKVFVEFGTWMSPDVKPEFWQVRKEFAKMMIESFMMISKPEDVKKVTK